MQYVKSARFYQPHMLMVRQPMTAAAAGFESLSTFNREFKCRSGRSPAEKIKHM